VDTTKSAQRLRSTCGQVFRYTLVTGRADRDPTSDLRGALTVQRVKHRPAIEILLDLQPGTGSGRFLFPSLRTHQRPMSENTLNAALRRLGYSKDEVTAHGFRSTAAVRLNEMGRWNPDAIERQLAHQENNEVRRAYTHAAAASPVEDLRSGASFFTARVDGCQRDHQSFPGSPWQRDPALGQTTLSKDALSRLNQGFDPRRERQ
jgi:hypothetical protein